MTRHREETAIFEPRRKAGEDANPAGTLTSDFSISELRENARVALKPSSPPCFVTAARVT